MKRGIGNEENFLTLENFMDLFVLLLDHPKIDVNKIVNV